MLFRTSNPIVNGWYADPEARFYEGRYWIYVTQSHTEYERQMNIDVFSSKDGLSWDKYENIIHMDDFSWIWRAVWAPTIIEKSGKYYLIFAANDIQNDEEVGGLAVAVSERPQGPFRKHMETPLVDRFINGAQPIDAHLFKDDDGTIYLYYGGWKHCNVAIMNNTMDGFLPLEDGSRFREITPEGYVEGPCMLKRNGIYHFMWSEGGWTNGTYHVCSGICPTPISRPGVKHTVLEAQDDLADGPGHHGYLNIPGTDQWKIVYHRRIVGDKEPGHRVLCIDDMLFEGDSLLPVKMS